MKMYKEINGLIVHDFKDYDKITKVKMLDAIYDVYSDYDNMIVFLY